jgi:hypothetical protein
VGLPAVIGVPHRDLLLACAADRPALVAALVARVAGDCARAPHGISPDLVRIDESGTLSAR